MIKKIFFLCTGILLACPPSHGASHHGVRPGDGARPSGRRALFVSVIQDPPVLSGRERIEALVDFAVRARIGILFVQVYRANKAWFPSKIGDSAPYEDGLKKVGEDPLALLIRRAHAAGIQVHAWLNMLSLSTNENAPLLKKYGPSILTKNLKDKQTLEDYKIDNQYFLEPGDLRVRRELTEMVEEILRAYPGLDGIQFDYIRYPDKDPAYGFTKMNVERFKKATGLGTVEEQGRAWKDWKRAQVTDFVRSLVKTVRLLRPDIRVSTTGCTPYVRAYHEAFQDWPSWVDGGLVDFVTIMSYSPDTPEFSNFVRDAKGRVNDFGRVKVGIGVYEMLRSPKTFEDQLRLCENSGAGSCAVFHYGSLLEDPSLGTVLLRGPHRAADLPKGPAE